MKQCLPIISPPALLLSLTHLGCFHTGTVWFEPEFVSLDSVFLWAGVKVHLNSGADQQANFGPPENVGLGSLAN